MFDTVTSLYPIVLILCAVLSIGAPLVGWMRGRTWRSAPLIMVAIGTALITLGAAMLSLSEDLSSALFWSRVENVGFGILVPSWVYFSQRYIGVSRRLKPWLYLLMGLYAAVTIGASLGPPSALTWSNPRFEPIGSGMHLVVDRGPLVWSAFIFTILAALVVMALFLRATGKVNRFYRWRIRLVPLAMLVPFYASLHDSLLLRPLPEIRFVPLGFAFFSVVLYFAVVHQRLGDLVPIARDLLLENLYEAVFVIDASGQIVDINSLAAGLAGTTTQRAMGQPLRRLLPALQRRIDARGLRRQEELEIELESTAGARVFEGRVSPVFSSADDFLGRVLVLQDVTERKANEARMRHLALHDALTGLPNRAALIDRAERAIERGRRSGGPGLLFLDLDRFKLVNDALGHAAGDRLLRQVAARLQNSSRAVDTVARMGADEFVVLLEGVAGEDDARAAAERYLACFEEPFDVAGHELDVGASGGLAFGLEELDSPDALLRSADLAMYRAKSEGGRRVVPYRPGLDRGRESLERHEYKRREGD